MGAARTEEDPEAEKQRQNEERTRTETESKETEELGESMRRRKDRQPDALSIGSGYFDTHCNQRRGQVGTARGAVIQNLRN